MEKLCYCTLLNEFQPFHHFQFVTLASSLFSGCFKGKIRFLDYPGKFLRRKTTDSGIERGEMKRKCLRTLTQQLKIGKREVFHRFPPLSALFLVNFAFFHCPWSFLMPILAIFSFSELCKSQNSSGNFNLNAFLTIPFDFLLWQAFVELKLARLQQFILRLLHFGWNRCTSSVFHLKSKRKNRLWAIFLHSSTLLRKILYYFHTTQQKKWKENEN